MNIAMSSWHLSLNNSVWKSWPPLLVSDERQLYSQTSLSLHAV